MQKQPSHSAHRYVPIEELQETNGRSSHLLLSQYATDAKVAEADVQVKKKDAELLRFESVEEELAALISVSLKPCLARWECLLMFVDSLSPLLPLMSSPTLIRRFPWIHLLFSTSTLHTQMPEMTFFFCRRKSMLCTLWSFMGGCGILVTEKSSAYYQKSKSHPRLLSSKSISAKITKSSYQLWQGS